MCRYRVNQHLIALHLYIVSINEYITTEFMTVKLSQNLNLMWSMSMKWNWQLSSYMFSKVIECLGIPAKLDSGHLDTWTLDTWTLRLWTLGLWTPVCLDSGQLDAWTLDAWNLNAWTLGLWTSRLRTPGCSDSGRLVACTLDV